MKSIKSVEAVSPRASVADAVLSLVGASELPPHAQRLKSIARDRTNKSRFFIGLTSSSIGLSTSAASRLLNNPAYSDFMIADKKNKRIKLKCSFPKGTKKPFVRLTAAIDLHN
jgi:hypothetical protein